MGSPLRLQCIFTAACSVVVFIAVITDVDRDQVGRRSAVHTAPVHRLLMNATRMPVPSSAWEQLGFAVHNYNQSAARALAAAAHMEDTWDSLPTDAARAGLFRLLAVATHGGWYADADLWPTPHLEALRSRYNLVLFNEACGPLWWNTILRAVGASTAPQFRNALFAAPAAWRPLRAALMLTAANAKRKATQTGLFSRVLTLFPDELAEATIIGCRFGNLYAARHPSQ